MSSADSEVTLESLNAKLDAIASSHANLASQFNAQKAREQNSRKEFDQTLEAVLNDSGESPPTDLGLTELTPSHFLVAGNERLPGGGPNDWNRNRSRAALRFYDIQGVFSDTSDMDTINEDRQSSRIARVKLAGKLGLTKAQLNVAFANSALQDFV
eukprot:GHVR01015504.1.p1 GENE.GHVR01015504.1~~GHVR01015504.1.p1  ORF type:complete len:156 (-),score=6.52 GHVR01015504.1:94-561(-)